MECVLLSDEILFRKKEDVIISFAYELIAHVIRIKAIYSLCDQLQYIVFNLKEACDTLVIIT